MARSSNIRILSVENLNERIVPATLNLMPGNETSGMFNGAIFQYVTAEDAGTGLNTFLKIDAANGSSERGYNSNARPVQFDEATGKNGNHAVKLADIPLVVIDNVSYREFCLDIKQKNGQPNLSLDEIRIYTSTTGNLSGYNSNNNKLGGQTARYDMDAGPGNNTVQLKDNPGLAEGDMLFFVPDSVFNGVGVNDFVHLYSKMGVNNKMTANNGAEEWSVRDIVVSPPGTGSISGRVFLDENQNGVFDTDGSDFAYAPLFVTLTDGSGAFVASVETNADGFYSFANLPAGNYTLTAATPTEEHQDGFDYAGGVQILDSNLGLDIISFSLGEGVNADEYNFTDRSQGT